MQVSAAFAAVGYFPWVGTFSIYSCFFSKCTRVIREKIGDSWTPLKIFAALVWKVIESRASFSNIDQRLPFPIRLQLGEVPGHLLRGHSLDSVRFPLRLVVAVNQHGSHAFEEVVVFTATLAQPVFDVQHVREFGQLRSFPKLPQSHLKGEQRHPWCTGRFGRKDCQLHAGV